MYSYNDRIRAVELYIKLDKRVRATIRQLGYPTKNALKSWHREYERRFDLPKGYARSKPKYSQVQKETAVRHYLDHGQLFAGSELAGQRAAVVMSLVQSAKLHGHDPWAYLKDVLTRLPTHLNSRIDELLPHLWQPAG